MKKQEKNSMENNLEKIADLFKFRMTGVNNAASTDLLERSKLLQEKIAQSISIKEINEESLILNVLKEKYKNG